MGIAANPAGPGAQPFVSRSMAQWVLGPPPYRSLVATMKDERTLHTTTHEGHNDPTVAKEGKTPYDS